MTNAEKWLKDGVNVTELANNLFSFAIVNHGINTLNYSKCIADFFKEEVKPTLTEDEKVILRNIKIHDCSKVYSLKITRACDNDLWLKVEGKSNKIKHLGIFIDINGSIPIDQYSHLFQFIKERRRILY